MGNSPSSEEYNQDVMFDLAETCSLLIEQLEKSSTLLTINLKQMKSSYQEKIDNLKNKLFEVETENKCLKEELVSVNETTVLEKGRRERLEKMVQELHEEIMDRREDKQNITEEFNRVVDEVHILKDTLGERMVTLQAVRSALTKEKQKTRSLQTKLKKNL